MKKVSSFRDLEVYKLCRQLAKEIFELSKKFPKEETYALTDQIRRASCSVGAQIAEAWGKRRYQKHFISKISDAGGEQSKHNIGLTARANVPTCRSKKPTVS